MPYDLTASQLTTRLLNVLHRSGDSLAENRTSPLAQNGRRTKAKRLCVTITDHMFVLQLYDVGRSAEWAR